MQKHDGLSKDFESLDLVIYFDRYKKIIPLISQLIKL